MDKHDILLTAKAIAQEAGKIMLTAFSKNKHVTSKSCATDLVTETDQQLEKLVQDRVSAKYPNHRFIGEESTEGGAKCELTDAPTWIVDPIDGTTNFVNSFPYCCMSIGVYENKEAQVAVIYHPMLNDMYWAVKGEGAYLNGDKIHVSADITSLSHSLIMTDWGSGRDEEQLNIKAENYSRIIRSVRGIRCFGAAVLHMCAVARGNCQLFFEFGIHCWDYAAGWLLVTEAGGCASACDGGPVDLMARNIMVACHPQVIKEMLPLIKNVPYPRD